MRVPFTDTSEKRSRVAITVAHPARDHLKAKHVRRIQRRRSLQ
jgi:hypothetical protein